MLRSYLKEMLNARRMSIREFSRRIDYHFESVRKLYNNELKQIPAELVVKTCRELNCSVGELFSIEEGGSSPD